jgi:hypothetical protein
MAIHLGDCSICLGDVCFGDFNTSKPNALRRKQEKGRKIGNIGERLKCGHMYHRKCILPWFLNTENEMSETCPMCRQDIRFSNRNEMLTWRLFSKKHALSRKNAQTDELNDAFWDDDHSDLSSEEDEYEYRPRYSLEYYEDIFENRPFQNIEEDDWMHMISTIRNYFSSEEETIPIETGILEFIMRIDNFLEDNMPLGSQIMSDSDSGSNDDESQGTRTSVSSSSISRSSEEKKYLGKITFSYSYRSQLRWVRAEEKAYRRKFMEKKTSWRPTHAKCR